MATQCQATAKGGARCRSTIGVSADGYCLHHDEKRKAIAADVCVRGGKASRRGAGTIKSVRIPLGSPAAPTSLAEIAAVQSWVAFQTYSGKMDARTSEATTKALRNQQLVLQKLETEDRVTELREKLKLIKTHDKAGASAS